MTARSLDSISALMLIALAAVWGGLALAVMSSIAFIPHVLLYIGQGAETYLSELTEIILYLAAGSVTGIIAGRESLLRRRYKELSEKLEKSYAKLHRETQLLLSIIYAFEGRAQDAHRAAQEGTHRGEVLDSPFVIAVGYLLIVLGIGVLHPKIDQCLAVFPQPTPALIRSQDPKEI